MWELTGLGLMGLGGAGFLFGLVSYMRDVRKKDTPVPGFWSTVLDESWIASSVVVSGGLALREGLDWPEVFVIFAGLVVVGAAVKMPLRRFLG